jgi:isoleucyl-tRNA synthetase
METVWWILKQIYNKDLMYKGSPFSRIHQSRNRIVHEVNQPGSYRDVTDTTVVAQFKAINELFSCFTRLWRYPYLLETTHGRTFKYCFDLVQKLIML